MVGKGPSLEEIFSPRGVAVVGASSSGRGFATGVTASLKAAGFPAIYPINPKYTEVFGLPCYPDLMATPGVVDHVVVSIPAESTLSLLDDCAAKGVKSVHFFTAGFSESGDSERAEMEKTMLLKAKASGFRIIGPNCIGLFVPKSRLDNTTPKPLVPGSIAFMSQSGGHAQNLPLYGAQRGLRFSKVVSYGNALDVDEIELLQYFTRDSETEIICAYIEGVKDGRCFLNSLREASFRKPVIIYKGGTTEAGSRTTRGHTASLTSSATVFSALCRQMNVIQVDNIDEMIDVLTIFSLANPLPEGNGIALVGAGGGPSVLASDEMEKAGLKLPQFSKETQQELLRFLPLAGSILSNPVDAQNLTTPEAIAPTLHTVSRLPEIQIIIYHLGFHPMGAWESGRFSSNSFLQPVIKAMAEIRNATGKPVLLALRPVLELDTLKEFLIAQEAFVKAGFPVFHSMNQAAKAISRVLTWKELQNR